MNTVNNLPENKHQHSLQENYHCSTPSHNLHNSEYESQSHDTKPEDSVGSEEITVEILQKFIQQCYKRVDSIGQHMTETTPRSVKFMPELLAQNREESSKVQPGTTSILDESNAATANQHNTKDSAKSLTRTESNKTLGAFSCPNKVKHTRDHRTHEVQDSIKIAINNVSGIGI